MSTTILRRACLGAAVGLCALPAAALSSVTTVKINSGDAIVTQEGEAPGPLTEAQTIAATAGPDGTLRITSTNQGQSIVAVAPCTTLSTTEVACPADPNNGRVLRIFAGGGNDTITLSLVDRNAAGIMSIEADGGGGSDRINGGPMAETLYGDFRTGAGGFFRGPDGTLSPSVSGTGDDLILGGGGRDTIIAHGGDDYLSGNGIDGASDSGGNAMEGGEGRDFFNAGDTPGPGDIFRGGQGSIGGSSPAESLFESTFYDGDIVSYRSRTFAPGTGAGVTADIDGIADDGMPGEGDTIGTDVESLAGTVRDDTLTGSASANLLRGETGVDTLKGLAGGDTFDLVDGVRDPCPDYGTGDEGQLDLVDPTVTSCVPPVRRIIVLPRIRLSLTPADEAMPAVVFERARLTARGAQAKIVCLTSARRACRGEFLLRAGASGKVSAKTRFVIAAGKSKTVSLAMKAAGKAKLIQLSAVIQGTSKKGQTTTSVFLKR